MSLITIKNSDLELHINPQGACVEAFYAYGIKIADKGITVGRYANRIGGSSFVIDGKEYQLAANEGRNILHGGPGGFSERLWNVESAEEDKLVLSIFSPDGDQGFPGNMTLKVEFSLSDNVLSVNYDAVCDKDCFVNFTNHMYFNINGGGDLHDHRLWLHSSRYTEVDSELIPTGRILAVDNSKYDYRSERIYQGGLDTNFVLWDGSAFSDTASGCCSESSTCETSSSCITASPAANEAAVLTGIKTGITVKCATTEPGIQVYDEGNQICLEAQHFPDSPHNPGFPSTLLKAEKHYFSTTKYSVSRG